MDLDFQINLVAHNTAVLYSNMFLKVLQVKNMASVIRKPDKWYELYVDVRNWNDGLDNYLAWFQQALIN